MQTESKTIKSYLTQNVFFTKPLDTADPRVINTKFFIPTVIEINGIQVPSTPFNFNDGNPLFLGDVVTYTLSDEFESSVLYGLIEFYNGSYYITGEIAFFDTPLSLFDETPLMVLGNAISNPELLDLLN